MRFLARSALLLLLASGVSASVSAQPREIQVEADAGYVHKPTEISLPPAIGTLARGRVAALQADDLDVLVDYRSADERDVTTVFLYRNAVGDVPLWFDRASKVIEQSPAKYGSVTPSGAAEAFVPPRQSAASGMRIAYATTGGNFTSTALAILPVADFYVKLRLSSGTLSPAQLNARLSETLAAFGWPQTIAAKPAAVPIADCQSSMVIKKAAKPAPADGGATLLSAMMPSVSASLAKEGKATMARWCRDPRVLQNAGLYRPDEARNRYLVAFQDAGRALSVGENSLASLLLATKGDARPRFSVELILLDENQGFGDFQSLPTPEQAVSLLESRKPLYRTSTVGKRNQINLSPEALGDK